MVRLILERAPFTYMGRYSHCDGKRVAHYSPWLQTQKQMQ